MVPPSPAVHAPPIRWVYDRDADVLSAKVTVGPPLRNSEALPGLASTLVLRCGSYANSDTDGFDLPLPKSYDERYNM
jgi:hypothetical protein